MLATITALNAGGWGLFALAILPRHFHDAGLGIGVEVAFTVLTLGCRRAFDADHIAAIDNSTRTIAARPVFRPVMRPTSTFEAAGGAADTRILASFLWLIARNRRSGPALQVAGSRGRRRRRRAAPLHSSVTVAPPPGFSPGSSRRHA